MLWKGSEKVLYWLPVWQRKLIPCVSACLGKISIPRATNGLKSSSFEDMSTDTPLTAWTTSLNSELVYRRSIRIEHELLRSNPKRNVQWRDGIEKFTYQFSGSEYEPEGKMEEVKNNKKDKNPGSKTTSNSGGESMGTNKHPQEQSSRKAEHQPRIQRQRRESKYSRHKSRGSRNQSRYSHPRYSQSRQRGHSTWRDTSC